MVSAGIESGVSGHHRRVGGPRRPGVILGCTEIPLLIQQEDWALPLFDTTRLHAEAALEVALGERAL